MPTLGFNLFPDADFEGTVEREISRTRSGRTLTGSLSENQGHFTLRVQGGVVAGSVLTTDSRLFQILPASGGLHVVQEFDPTALPPCAVVEPPDAGTLAPGAPTTPETAGDSAGQFDVLVAYTADARTAAGGIEGIEALIQLAVDETNLAYEDSQINSSLRLVHTAEVNYTESGSLGTDLSRLWGRSDGFMDSVHSLRDQHGADLVSLIVQNGDHCGIGYLMTSLSQGFESNAFSVVRRSCATGYYSFGHELGHNMGCHHDHNNPGTGLHPYSYGHHFGPETNPDAYRTVMAYSPGARVRRFSNPNSSYSGYPTGIPVGEAGEAHNALSINSAAFTIANWRQSVDGGGNGTPASVTLDSEIYIPSGTVVVTVSDAGESGSVSIMATTDSGDSETFDLGESSSGVFTGSLDLNAGSPVAASGILEVSDSDQITITYTDTSPPESVVDTALIDGAPPTFAGLDSVQVGDSQITLAWLSASDQSSPITYRVHRAEVAGAQDFNSPLASTTSLDFTDASAVNGTTYHYVVQAEDSLGNVDSNRVELSGTPARIAAVSMDQEVYGPSDTVRVDLTDDDAPPAPIVSLTVNGGDAESLTLQVGEPGQFAETIETSTGTPQLGDGILQVNDGAVITAVYTDESVGADVSDTAIVDAAAPSFGGLAAAEPGSGEVTLSWQSGSDPNGPVRYSVFRSTGSGQQDFTSPTAITESTTHLDTGLLNGVAYHYVVRAEDRFGNVDGNTVEIAAVPQAPVTWGPLHHFTWSPVGSPQTVGEPFAVTITARDSAGAVVQDFTGAAELVARQGNKSLEGLITPVSTGDFIAGVWSGEITTTAAVSGVHIRATALRNKRGDSAVFDVLESNLPSVSVQDAEVTEGDSGSVDLVFLVTLSAPSASASVGFAVEPLSATESEDYQPVSGVLIFTGGQTVQTVSVPVIGDQESEENETLELSLSEPVGLTIADGTALGTILDDDAAPTLSIANMQILEGQSGTTLALVEITLSHRSAVTVTVTYDTSNASAKSPSDFLEAAGALTFPPDSTSQLISVEIVGDQRYEKDESFRVRLSNPAGATIAAGQANATILNDDAHPRFGTSDVSVTEGDEGRAAARFTVTLEGETDLPARVDYRTEPGSAAEGSDFIPATGSLLFEPGETEQAVEIDVLGDAILEGQEAFTLVLSAPVSATVEQGSATARIDNDDRRHSAALKWLRGEPCSADEREAADVNEDGRVDAADVVSGIENPENL